MGQASCRIKGACAVHAPAAPPAGPNLWLSPDRRSSGSAASPRLPMPSCHTSRRPPRPAPHLTPSSSAKPMTRTGEAMRRPAWAWLYSRSARSSTSPEAAASATARSTSAALTTPLLTAACGGLGVGGERGGEVGWAPNGGAHVRSQGGSTECHGASTPSSSPAKKQVQSRTRQAPWVACLCEPRPAPPGHLPGPHHLRTSIAGTRALKGTSWQHHKAGDSRLRKSI